LAGLALSTILNHPTFFTTFRARNHKLLSDRYSLCTSILKAYSIPYMPSNAGFFLWADLSQYLHSQPGDTPLQREQSLNELLFNGGVHMATSEAFSGEDSGWFRITFSVDEKLLKLGLNRYTTFLMDI
jgi:DNA-binding transcriptional MocR family regulator